MAKSRMRKKDDDGLFAVQGLVQEQLLRRLDNGRPLPTVSEVLVELLNGNVLTAEGKGRVKRIFHLLQFQEGYASQVTSRLHLDNDVLTDTYADALITTHLELSKRLLRYKIIPQIHPIGTAPRLFFISSHPSDRIPEKAAEIGAVMCALQLADRGQIDSVRRCSCGVFFVPSRIDQNYHDTKCRVKAHQSSEEFKTKRRKADRERYRLHREGKVKEGRGRNHGTQKTR